MMPGRVSLARVAIAMACGLLWGGAVTAVDTLAQPSRALGTAALVELVLAIGWTWAVCGVWWALAALALRRLAAGWLFLAIPPLALLVSLLHFASWQLGLNISLNGGSAALLGEPPPPEAIFFHTLWMNLFFGGIFLIGATGSYRASHARQALHQLAASRMQVEAERQQYKLGALRGQIQPQILIEAIGALHVAYASFPERAELLFGQLVDFLRAAMPGIRGDKPMLAAELDLVAAFATLRHEVGGGSSAAIEIDRDGTPPTLLFPPLCLLPVVDDIVRTLPASGRLHIAARREPHDFLLCLTSTTRLRKGPLLAPATERRLRLGLAALYGAEASLAIVQAARSLIIEIRLPLAASQKPPLVVPLEQRIAG